MNIYKNFFSKIGFNYLILGVLAIIFQIIILNILNLTHPEYLTNINITSIITSICNYILPFPIFYWLMKKIKTEKIKKTKITKKTFIIYIAITLTLMWIGNMAGIIITTILSNTLQSQIANPVQQLINSADIWFNIIIISIMAPIFEEILFRKILIDRTIKYGAKVSIILSATIFALFHGNLNQFFYALLMGGFFAYIYIKTGKITYTITLHLIVNIMGSVVSLIVANSINNLQTAITTPDIIIILTYIIILAISFTIGIIYLLKYKQAKFNGEKTQIPLKKPYKSWFINYGMICFIAFYIFEILYQILG